MEELPDLEGCLLGIAVGDSLGLPFEGLSATRIDRRLANRPLRQSLLFGRGMLSDDTEQTCLVLEAAIKSGGDVGRFQKEFAKRLRGWFLALPAGVGLATVRACLRLCVGIKPDRSGVPSAGNGAAMRAPILGALFAHDEKLLDSFITASSEVTHRDPRAIDGARGIAFAVAFCRSLDARSLLAALSERCKSSEWQKALSDIQSAWERQASVEEFANELGCRGKVSGFVMHSVPVALYTWLRRPQEAALGLEKVIRLGGDTDTTGAMLGALYGASLGIEAFPAEWRSRIADWRRSQTYLKKLAEAARNGSQPPKVAWLATLPRNLFFLIVVLAHGFRRLIP